MTALCLSDRTALFARLENRRFDLLVIGGGITGAGIARDAALRGLSVCLVEAEDFASGTSSRSSKLIHGGLRYLAQGDFAVVREAARERKAVRTIAPHLARRNDLIVPAKTLLELAVLKIGLTLFDWLGQVPKAERHQLWFGKRLKREEPLLAHKNYRGAIVYPEYLTNDARLTVANMRAAAGLGAEIANYARVTGFVLDGGEIKAARVTGTLPGEDRQAEIRATKVVNAAGPWVDQLRALEDADAECRLKLTKGIHVVVPRAKLPLGRTVVMKAPDGRMMFAIPYGEASYFGTTDTFYPDEDLWPDITHEDVRYTLETGNRAFGSDLSFADVTGLWSGIRPLLAEEGKDPSEISRKDEVLDGKGGMISIAGGKLTAYRQMAERIVDRVERELGRPVSTAPTASALLPGGDVDDLDDLIGALQQAGAAPDRAATLAYCYGSEAMALWHDGGDAAAEARHGVRAEGAVRLEDWWVRRTARAWFDPDGGLAALEAAADAMAAALGWDGERRQAEIAACRARHAALMAPVCGPQD